MNSGLSSFLAVLAAALALENNRGSSCDCSAAASILNHSDSRPDGGAQYHGRQLLSAASRRDNGAGDRWGPTFARNHWWANFVRRAWRNADAGIDSRNTPNHPRIHVERRSDNCAEC
jgi:hypothetical protein